MRSTNPLYRRATDEVKIHSSCKSPKFATQALSDASISAKKTHFSVSRLLLSQPTRDSASSLFSIRKGIFLWLLVVSRKIHQMRLRYLLWKKNELSMGRRSSLSKATGNLLSGNRLTSTGPASQPVNSTTTSYVDNARLEHDVAFLKVIMDDTQKELHTKGGVLAGERARAF